MSFLLQESNSLSKGVSVTFKTEKRACLYCISYWKLILFNAHLHVKSIIKKIKEWYFHSIQLTECLLSIYSANLPY